MVFRLNQRSRPILSCSKSLRAGFERVLRRPIEIAAQTGQVEYYTGTSNPTYRELCCGATLDHTILELFSAIP
jgi:hypothetical protein